MKTTKKALSILLSVLMIALTVSCLSACFTASAYTTIEFGNYPQTRVEPTLKMKEAALAAQWKSYGYYSGTGDYDGNIAPSDFMQYADFYYNDTKYRAVTFSNFRPDDSRNESSADKSQQDDNGFTTGEIYCFRYEPLKWRVLDFSAGLVMCENIIDAQAFNDYVLKSANEYYGNASKDYYASNYYYSSIRKWLNEDFWGTAFNQAQKEKIKTTTLDNSAENANYSAPSSNDKIFLLSLNDATSHGFLSSIDDADAARIAKGTEYAKCQGLWCHSTGNSSWWLRTPVGSGTSWGVISDGEFRASYIYLTSLGIRPACCLTTLTSDTTPPEDPGTQEPQPAPCPWCGGVHDDSFFQKIVAWFHNIFASLFGAKY